MERSQHHPLLIYATASILTCVAGHASSAQSFEAVSRPFNNGVVRISAVFRDRSAENGFGFVVREVGDSLFFVTASHVVQPTDADQPSDSILVHFYDRDEGARAVVLNQDPALDLALLFIPKPHGFSWRYRRAVADVVAGDNVWIVGRDLRWRETARDMKGTVTESRNEIVADFTGAEPGASGGPLLARRGIAGMVIDDEGNEVTALSIGVVRNVVYRRWLNVQGLDRLRDFPFVVVTGGAGFPAVVANPAGRRTIPPLMWSAALDAAFGPNVGLGIAAARGGTDAIDVRTLGRHFQFRNPSTTYSASIRFYPASTLESPEYGLLGIWYLRINPQLRVDDGAWKALRDADSVTYEYEDHAWGFGVGAGMLSLSAGNVVAAFDMSIVYTTSPYLSINALDPYKAQTKNDWLFLFSVRVGYVFRRGLAKLRILR